jgi:hypothetical protein
MPAGPGLERCLEPIDIAGLRLRSRLMMTMHGPRLPQRRYLPYLDARSRAVALVGVRRRLNTTGSNVHPGPHSLILERFRLDGQVAVITEFGRSRGF